MVFGEALIMAYSLFPNSFNPKYVICNTTVSERAELQFWLFTGTQFYPGLISKQTDLRQSLAKLPQFCNASQ
jgi:hypothetical protein